MKRNTAHTTRMRAGITHDLNREFLRAYPELAHRINSARTPSQPPEKPELWQRLLRNVLLIAALLILVWLAPRSTIGAPAPDVQAGTLFLQGAKTQRALLLNTDVAIRAAGIQAQVTVRQSFVNTSDLYREGLYTFPLPERTAVNALTVRVGERVINGEIRLREQARTTYEAAKRDGKQASLLEQQRPNLFTLAVANIAPGELVRVEIRYLQRLRVSNGEYELRFPLTLTPRFNPPVDEPRTVADMQPVATPMVATAMSTQRAQISARIDAGAPLQQLTSEFHPIDSNALPDDAYQLTLRDGEIPTDRDFVLRWIPLAGTLPESALFREVRDDGTYALLMVTPPAADAHAPLARETIFVLDVSGSMAGASLVQALAALNSALQNLRDTDYFNIITFSSSTRALFPAAVPAHPQSIAHAQQLIGQLQADGGTVMAPALAMALAGNPPLQTIRQIVFITDGAVSNERELLQLIENDLGAARLFMVGIGSAPNGHFMRESARAGRGTFTYIGDLAQVRAKMSTLLHKLQRPVMSNVRITWPPDSGIEALPARLPDLYAGEPLMVSARADMLTGSVLISGDLAGLPWSRTLSLDEHRDADGIATLWARDKIHHLDYAERTLDEPSRRDIIVNLALAHRLVTRHTSFVAVEEFPSRPQNAGFASAAIANTMPRGNTMLAFPAGATDARGHVAVGLLLLLIGVYLRRAHWLRHLAS
ncbi:MAG: marine proteobacterial sortase target protein [Gammaproteobacteria bacterium]|nr:marine proteobacterial sortase target protein [Gammaproteobacteria bacterium]